MDCVSCHEPMIVLEVDQVEVDYCLTCEGVWLDSGELEILLDNPASVEKVLSEAITSDSQAKSLRKCPVCLKKMEEIKVGSGDMISIDRCVKGHGLWFDKGELEQVVGLFHGPEAQKIAKLLKDIFRK